MPTRSSSFCPRARASAFESPFTSIGGRVTFSITVLWAKRLNCWKTIPISERSFAIALPAPSTERPSKRTSPSSTVSRPLMQRNIVDLPEPEGPAMTTTSPRPIDRSIPSRTRFSPKLLRIERSSTRCAPSLTPASLISPSEGYWFDPTSGLRLRVHAIDRGPLFRRVLRAPLGPAARGAAAGDAQGGRLGARARRRRWLQAPELDDAADGDRGGRLHDRRAQAQGRGPAGDHAARGGLRHRPHDGRGRRAAGEGRRGGRSSGAAGGRARLVR